MPWSTTETITDEEYSNENRDRERDIRCDGADGEDGTDCNASAENEKEQETADESVKPDSVYRGVGVFVHPLDPGGKWEAVITGIGKRHSGRGNHATLPHGETAYDGQAKNGEGSLLRHHLDEIRCPRLTEIRVKDGRDVDDGVRNDELQCPSCEASEATGHDDGSWGSYISIAAFLGKMERRVVSRHGPDNGNETHEDSNSIRPVCSILNRPDLFRRKEFRSRVRACHSSRNHNDNHKQPNHVQRRTERVEPGDPESRHAGDAAVDQHHEDGEEVGVPILWRIARMRDRSSGENHSTERIINGRRTSNLHHPIRPASYPCGEGSPSRRS